MNPLQSEQKKKAEGKWLSLKRPQSSLNKQRGAYLTITAITFAFLLGNNC